MHQRGEAVAVAMAVRVGGDGCARRLRVRETEEGAGARESARGFQGRAWWRWRRPGDEGEAAGSRRLPGACRRASATRAVYWRGEEDDREGPGGLGRPLGPPGGCTGELAQISFCSLFSKLFLFSIFL